MPGTAKLLKRNVSNLVTLTIGILVFLSIPDQIALFETEGLSSVNARTVPYLIASLIVILSLLMIISEVIATRNEAPSVTGQERKQSTSYGRVFLACAAIALWIAILPYLGFIITTILLIASIMIIIGNCQWWQIVLLCLILSVPINYLLASVLRVYLPSGSLFD